MELWRYYLVGGARNVGDGKETGKDFADHLDADVSDPNPMFSLEQLDSYL